MPANTLFDDIIIGAGMAGLAAALLARDGRRVLVLEAHDVPGGYAHTFRVRQYRFCAFMSTPTLHSPEPGLCPPGEQILEIATALDHGRFARLRREDRRAYNREKKHGALARPRGASARRQDVRRSDHFACFS